MIIDIHTHTYPTSVDSLLTSDELVDEAKRIGLDGICITDHDGFWDHDEVFEISKRHDFLVLPGCEVTTEDGHLLVYGLWKYIFGMHRAVFVKELVEREGGAIVVAHPYRRTYRKHADTGPAAYYEMLEVFNGRGSKEENAFSHELANRFNLPGTGASDAHMLEDLGTFATEFQRRVSSLEDLIAELRAGRFSPIVLNRPTVPDRKRAVP